MDTPTIPPPPDVDAISKLNDLERLAEEFLRRTGYEPELISHWNPKPSFSCQIESWIIDPKARPNLIDYVYSSDISVTHDLKTRLRENENRGLLLTPSGTTSVVNACAYLRNTGTEHLVVLTPTYFSVEAIASILGLSVSYIDITRNDGSYKLPDAIPIIAGRKTAVWLTFPVYGASTYFAPNDVARLIDSTPPTVVVVVDESLAYLDRPGLETTATSYRVLRICTPHKALCINGEKVSFLTFPNHLLDNMDAWSDCFAGGIGAAGVRALSFIVGDQFEKAVERSRDLTHANLTKLKRILSTKVSVSMDENTDGYFVTLYWNSLPASLGEDPSFMTNILEASGALPIPSSRNRHPAECGFCFRINLFRLDEAALGAISRLVDAIDLYSNARASPLA